MNNTIFNKASIKELDKFSKKTNCSFSLDKSLNVILSKGIQRYKKEVVIYNKDLSTSVFEYLKIDKI